MQTFLPYPNFKKSAMVLDRQRLGKQRCEGMQILKVLLGLGKINKNGNVAWSNHPAVKMWKGYESTLLLYIIDICDEWISRGYKDTCKQKSINMWNSINKNSKVILPPWLGMDVFHSGHRQTLLEKNYNHYIKFNWKETPKYEYWWPTENL